MNKTECFLCLKADATIFGDEVDAAKSYDLMCSECGCDYTIQKGAAEIVKLYPKTKREDILHQVKDRMPPASGQYIFVKRVNGKISVELKKNQERESEGLQ